MSSSTPNVIDAPVRRLVLVDDATADELISPAVVSEKAADILGVSTVVLRWWRTEGRGPSYVRYGSKQGRVLYRMDDLDAFLKARAAEDPTKGRPEARAIPRASVKQLVLADGGAADKPVDPAVMTEKAADILGITPLTLVRWRKEGRGPSYVLYGPRQGRFLYRICDLEAFLRANTVEDPAKGGLKSRRDRDNELARIRYHKRKAEKALSEKDAE